MKHTHQVLRLLLVSILLFFYCAAVNAQSGGSGISGFVYDESSKAIDGATIAVKNTATGFSTTTTTDKKGYFTLRDLPVGPYNIEISAVGTQTTLLKDNVLNLGDRLVLHKITLSKNATTLTEVTVHSTSFNNSVDRLGTGTAVSGRALQKIPVASRNYTDLVALSPLANGHPWQAPKLAAPVICWTGLATVARPLEVSPMRPSPFLRRRSGNSKFRPTPMMSPTAAAAAVW